MSIDYKDIMAHMPEEAGPLVFPVCETVGGNAKFIDLSKAPHVLFAGVTGSGKSVALNTAITAMLERNEGMVEFYLVDPKRVELSIYRDARGVEQVVTEMDEAAQLIEYIVEMMDDRYERMEELAVRKIDDYNAKAPEPMPYMVLVVDELADLMMTNGKVVLPTLARIGQLGRAAGIHMMLATQRPAADVIPKMLLANVPTRIALTVQSHTESRLIIGEKGAEDLNGNGDMLVQVPGEKGLTHGQGPWLSDDVLKEIIADLTEESAAEDDFDEEVEDFDDDEADEEEVGIHTPEREAGPTGRDDYVAMAQALRDLVSQKPSEDVGDLYERILEAERRGDRLEAELSRERMVSRDQAEKIAQVRADLSRAKSMNDVYCADVNAMGEQIARQKESLWVLQKQSTSLLPPTVWSLLVVISTAVGAMAGATHFLLAALVPMVAGGITYGALRLESKLKEEKHGFKKA